MRWSSIGPCCQTSCHCHTRRCKASRRSIGSTTHGVETLVDSSCYRVQTYTTPGALIWIERPVTETTPVAWRIEYSSGSPVVDLEASLKRLVGVLAAHYLIAGRDAVAIGTIVATVPLAFDESLDPWRLLVIP